MSRLTHRNRRRATRQFLGLLLVIQTSYGQTSFQWLLDSAHPRDIALANAMVAAPNGAQALGVNPAGISLGTDSDRSAFTLSFRQDPAAIYQVSTQAVFPLGKYVAAVELRNVRYGSLPGYDTDGISTGDYMAGDLLLAGGLSRIVGRYLKFGAAVGSVLGRLGEYSSTGVYWSAGIQLNIERFDLRLGMVTSYNGSIVQQVTETSDDILPTTRLVGLEKSLAHLPLTIYIAGGKSVVSDDLIWRLAGEFKLGQKIRFRLGVDHDRLGYSTDDEYGNLLAGISIGLGYFSSVQGQPQAPKFDLQWGLKMQGPLGMTNGLSLSLSL